MSNVHTAGEHEHHFGHHWASADAEFQGAKQGMWVFMVTEVLMFGGLFVAYAIFRGLYPEMFHEAHKYLNVTMGATNTIVLITSSLTMAYGVSCTQRGETRKAIMSLAATFLLACCFLVIKYFEYAHKFHDHLLPEGLLPPGVPFNPEIHAPKAQLFFSIYFMMTGLHGIHVLIGMGLITWLIIRSKRGDFTKEYFTPVELIGFYWHFVDLVWIFLFPLLYLVG